MAARGVSYLALKSDNRRCKLQNRGMVRRPTSRRRLNPVEASFDLVVSYLTLFDITDFRLGLQEMVRVLRPNGTPLIANLNSFVTSCRMDGSRTWMDDTCTIGSIDT